MASRPNKRGSLYIHIPFCDSICTYCDFPKLLRETGYAPAYVTALLNELQSEEIPADLFTVYVGGGTPTALNDGDLKRLLEFLAAHFPSVQEFTVEANPENLSASKVEMLRRYGVNRVSLGVQTFDPGLLAVLGRRHNRETVITAVDCLKQNGFSNINLDFIYGIPGQTLVELSRDIDVALAMKPEHLSFYALQIEDGTVLANKHYAEPDGDLLSRFYRLITQKLHRAGYERYEVSNFARPGFESRHNLTYWHNDDYYAAGLGATSYVKGIRTVRTKNLSKYLKGDYVATAFFEDSDSREFNYLMLNLRLRLGFSLADFRRRYGHDFLISYADELKKLAPYLTVGRGRVKVKSRYLYVLDSILVDLLHFKEK